MSQFFKPGTVVTVYNRTFSGKPIIEGRATIVRRIRGVEGQYRVRFNNGDCVDRFVMPGKAQTDPETYLAELQADFDTDSRTIGAEQISDARA